MRVYSKKTRPRIAKKMEELKEIILKERAEKISIRKIATEHNINEGTLGDWLYFWRHGVKRYSEITRKSYRKKNERPAKYKRVWSPEAIARRKMITEMNEGKIEHIKKEDSAEDKRNIRYICGLI